MVFQDLPPEILSEIFSHIVKPQHLASLCLVNNSFRRFAVCKLYERVSVIYSASSWDKDGNNKAIKIFTKLFDTLSHYPYLALFVYRLEIRKFPMAPYDNVLRQVLSGLKNCANLRSCAWTRDISLNSTILETLNQCKNLRELELDGSDIGDYDPQLLLGFTELHRLSLFMTSMPVVCQLEPWFSITGAALRSLTLLCESPTILTDKILEAIAPSLVNLEHLNLSGCYSVTYLGVWAIVSSSTNGILGLGLQYLSYSFDMAAFANLCIPSGALRRLRSFSLITRYSTSWEWVKHVVHLLSDSPLEIFQSNSPESDEVWTPLILMHGKRLLRISVLQTRISWEMIHRICVQCTKLEQLFLTVDPDQPDHLDKLGSNLSFAKALRTIHITYYIEQVGKRPPVLSQSQALSILDKCSSTVTQFGCDAQVWQVSREIKVNEDGSMEAHRILIPCYESLNISEQFLVVKA